MLTYLLAYLLSDAHRITVQVRNSSFVHSANLCRCGGMVKVSRVRVRGMVKAVIDRYAMQQLSVGG